LLKEYSKLWVFGDSYTTPYVCVDPVDSFWGLAANVLQVNSIVNCSRSGNSFTTVQQLLVGMSQKIDWDRDMIFVGIPPLERITIFNNHINAEYLGYNINTTTWEIDRFDIEAHRDLGSLNNYGSDRQLILHSNRSWVETDVLRQIFLLTKWLDSINANYLIINLSKDLEKNNCWGPSNFVLPYCKKHNKCILFDKTYYSINIGINKPADSDAPYGHHGPLGNQHFFEQSLLLKLVECYSQTQANTPAEVLESLISHLDFTHAKRIRT
jgi:hypothetical protein